MNKITTRTRITIVTLTVTGLYLILQEVSLVQLLNLNFLNFDPIKPLLLASIIYVGTYWALFFKISGERFITILLFPAIGVLAFSLFSELLIATILPGLSQLSLLFSTTIVFGIFTYIVLLTVNILNS